MTRKEAAQAREAAMARGATTFWTGNPCKRGHIAPRYVANAACTHCSRLKARDHYHNVIKADPILYAQELERLKELHRAEKSPAVGRG